MDLSDFAIGFHDICLYEDKTYVKEVYIDAVRAKGVACRGYADHRLILPQPLYVSFLFYPFIPCVLSPPCLLHQLVQAGQGRLEA